MAERRRHVPAALLLVLLLAGCGAEAGACAVRFAAASGS